MVNLITPKQFFDVVWPVEGPYCIAVPFIREGKEVFAHYAADDIDDAISISRNICFSEKKHAFFAVHSLIYAKQPNPRMPGKFKTFRTHDNMKACKALILDVDVGESLPDKPKKYADQPAAWAALEIFLFRTGLPDPYVVSSGGGLHVYWPFDVAIPSREWRLLADKLRWLCDQFGLLVDHSRTTDMSSVLRVPGTINYKPHVQKHVQVVALGTVTPLDDLKAKLEQLTFNSSYMNSLPTLKGDPGNMGAVFDGRVTPPDEVFNVCEHAREFRNRQGLVDEPWWYVMLGLLRPLEGGEALAHELSKGDPRYDPEETQTKLNQWGELGPPTCNKINSVCGGDICAKCPFQGKGRNPIDIANKVWAEQAKPTPQMALAKTGQYTQLQNPSPPFQRSNGGVGVYVADPKNPNGFILRKFLNYDLFPIEHVRGTGSEPAYSTWVVELPLEGQMTFTMDTLTLNNQAMFGQKLSDNAVYVPDPHDLALVRKYMLHYLKDLQQKQKTQPMYDHLGWAYPDDTVDGEPTHFVLYGTRFKADGGDAEPCAMSNNTDFVKPFLKSRGTLAEQIDTLRFYKHPFYRPHQFLILAGLSSPWLRATAEHGVVIVAVGETGASKSTALYTAASMWGEPKGYVINGTPDGATARARDDRTMAFQNLPICIDEITLFEPDDARRTVFSHTQPGGRDTLDSSRRHRKHRGGLKATFMLATSNASLNQMLNTKNVAGQAGTVRVIEIPFPKTGMPHTKNQADEFLFKLSKSFGHIGPELMVKLLSVRAKVEQKIRAEIARLSTQYGITPEERFWVSAAAVVLTIGRIAFKLGFHEFDMQALETWFFSDQLPVLRNRVKGEMAHNAPDEIMANYLDQISGELVRIELDSTGNLGGLFRMPAGGISGRIDVGQQEIWLRHDRFKNYCVAQGHNRDAIISALKGSGVIKASDRRILTKGLEGQEMMRSLCYIIDMKHKSIKGAI